MVKEFRLNQQAIFERNPDYYQTGEDGNPLPYIQEQHAFPLEDYASLVAAMRAGLIDAKIPRIEHVWLDSTGC